MSEPLILAIDASTYRGTVAVLSGTRVIAAREVAMRGEREERLMPAIAEALGDANVDVTALERVVVGGGPGSFTSLRIGAALAKGICSAIEIALAAMPSLALLVAGGEPALADGRYLAVLDAMRGDYYAALIEFTDALVVSVGDTQLMPRGAIARYAADRGATVAGVGEQVDAMPHARGLARLDPSLVHDVSLTAWEPTYGRLAEAQVKWEAQHGRSLAAG